ncbi:hypothetical protein DMC25_07350 [Caulobacter sp. D4A]|nr:hypothetical protein DMC25_07350 [Caulobacter sp. D4A]
MRLRDRSFRGLCRNLQLGSGRQFGLRRRDIVQNRKLESILGHRCGGLHGGCGHRCRSCGHVSRDAEIGERHAEARNVGPLAPLGLCLRLKLRFGLRFRFRLKRRFRFEHGLRLELDLRFKFHLRFDLGGGLEFRLKLEHHSGPTCGSGLGRDRVFQLGREIKFLCRLLFHRGSGRHRACSREIGQIENRLHTLSFGSRLKCRFRSSAIVGGINRRRRLFVAELEPVVLVDLTVCPRESRRRLDCDRLGRNEFQLLRFYWRRNSGNLRRGLGEVLRTVVKGDIVNGVEARRVITLELLKKLVLKIERRLPPRKRIIGGR